MIPAKLAIVGGGPSAFYVASRVMSLLPKHSSLRVHMYDRLWAPHGLVRYGVAPDHPEVKNCTHKFDEVASDPRFRFFGNVNVSAIPSQPPNPSHSLALPLDSLLKNYTHLLLASGCTLPSLHPNLAPSAHCISALSLVHWYTDHPSSMYVPPLDKLRHVTIIGNGNVALDVARILLTPPSELSTFDLPKHVLDVLSRSTVEHVSIVGRRGPLEAAFTTKELREMMNLTDAHMLPIPSESLTPPENAQLTRQQSRVLDLLRKGSKNKPRSTRKSWSLDFFRSPVGLTLPTSTATASTTSDINENDSNEEDALLTLAHTTLSPTPPYTAIPTSASSTLPTSLVITSLGFRSEPTQPFYDSGLGRLRAVEGRIASERGKLVKNVYASGWAAVGARGVLARTMIDAYAVGDVIAGDLLKEGKEEEGGEEEVVMASPSQISSDGPPEEIQRGIEDGKVVEYEDWRKVDAEEVRRGQEFGKERERMGWTQAKEYLHSIREK